MLTVLVAELVMSSPVVVGSGAGDDCSWTGWHARLFLFYCSMPRIKISR